MNDKLKQDIVNILKIYGVEVEYSSIPDRPDDFRLRGGISDMMGSGRLASLAYRCGAGFYMHTVGTWAGLKEAYQLASEVNQVSEALRVLNNIGAKVQE